MLWPLTVLLVLSPNILFSCALAASQQADQALVGFLRGIKESHLDDFQFAPIVHILVQQCGSKARQKCAAQHMHAGLTCALQEKFNRLTAITWALEFVGSARQQLVPLYPQLLDAVMRCISDTDKEIRMAAERANQELLELVKQVRAGALRAAAARRCVPLRAAARRCAPLTGHARLPAQTRDELNYAEFLGKLTLEMISQDTPTRVAALTWVSMLLEKSPSATLRFVDELFPVLCRMLSDVSEQVVLLDVSTCTCRAAAFAAASVLPLALSPLATPPPLLFARLLASPPPPHSWRSWPA